MVQEKLLRVVNMSFGYLMTAQNPDLQLVDAFEQPIAGLQGATLFVAAAGNAGLDKTFLCDIRPACFDMPNVIAVAAIDRSSGDPSFLNKDTQPHSNYGRRIHVASVGQDVFSTLANGKLGMLTGTSQAAPIVASVASLMFAKYQSLKPIEVKNRLIYCSDLFQSLEDKLFGGRVNADCTLDGDTGRLRLKGVVGEPQHGKLDTNATLVFADTENGEIKMPVQNIRAVHYNSWNDSYTVFHTSRTRPDSTLLRSSGLTFRDGAQAIKFTPAGPGQSPTSIPVGQIVQFVSPVT
jgi:subtilisin family serine protease